MKTSSIFRAALATAMVSIASESHAQDVLSQHDRGTALVVSGFGGFGFDRGGAGRVQLELQHHFGGIYQGPMLGIGLSAAGGWGGYYALGARLQWDIKLFRNTAFFLSPYIGADVGLWYNGCSGSACLGFGVMPYAGLEWRIIIANRLLLGLRLPGIIVPVWLGYATPYWFGLEGGVTIGITL